MKKKEGPLFSYNIKTGVFRIHCEKCGYMEKFSAARNIPDLMRLAKKAKWHIQDAFLDIHIYCPECKYVGRKRKGGKIMKKLTLLLVLAVLCGCGSDPIQRHDRDVSGSVDDAMERMANAEATHAAHIEAIKARQAWTPTPEPTFDWSSVDTPTPSPTLNPTQAKATVVAQAIANMNALSGKSSSGSGYSYTDEHGDRIYVPSKKDVDKLNEFGKKEVERKLKEGCKKVKCQTCRGTGYVNVKDGRGNVCSVCFGSGWVWLEYVE